MGHAATAALGRVASQHVITALTHVAEAGKRVPSAG